MPIFNIVCDEPVLSDALCGVLKRHGVFEACAFLTEGDRKQADFVLSSSQNNAGVVRAGRILDEILMRCADAKGDDIDIYVFGAYRLNPLSLDLCDANGKVCVRLTEKERDILVFLKKHGGMATRAALLAHVWEYADTVETHTLETHIYRLRQKIERHPARPEILLTIEDGYKIGT